ncbi:MFS transporter [Paenibacillus apiarius]|uniref:MFS transporter n=1 Tax=Paenibacillus apiarius TaxID=46240 RepID=A0ABT4E1C0_9BACL|nr:MFS transporter [Paenibacillus apiarius]MCY9517418.1 MFS transporter [Paenibacillus apiarius]MCY9522303.1 MFS transporter [Paenibacillus apiarius]MCY9555408.1 MFS transporter [Paenibacillus apiarius]MCY9560216.1 MFS transporter [Paenibacillus apiarius]MCY9683834.1 MFS transporter [Paenibacillus apiarius]
MKTPTVPYKGNDKLIVGIVFGVITFWLFAQSMVNIVPDVQADLGISLDTLNIAISLTALFSGIFIVVAGGLADKFGRMKMTYIGLILSIIGSLLLILAHGSGMLIAGRIIQGLSAACIMPATLALMKTYFEGAERQRALSFWSIGSWGGSGVCSFAGGAIATYMGWRWIFVFSIVFALLAMLLIKGAPESKSKVEQSGSKGRFDFGGLVTFVITLVTLNLIITRGSSFGWTSAITLSLAVVFLVSTFIFFKIEFRHANGFIDFSLFKNKAYTGATVSNFLLNAAAGTLVVANTYVQIGRGFTAFESGLLSLGYLVCVLVMIRVGEKLLQKHGSRKPMITGSLITAIGIAMMSFTFVPGFLYTLLVFVGFMLFGIGLGMYATPSTDTAVSNAPESKVGIASGIYKMASSLGGSFGVAISASVYGVIAAAGSIELAAMVGLLTNVAFCVVSLLSVIITAPKGSKKDNVSLAPATE